MSQEDLIKMLRSLSGMDARAGAPLGTCMLEAANAIAALVAERDESDAARKSALEIAKAYHAERDAAVADAERYRWLVSLPMDGSEPYHIAVDDEAPDAIRKRWWALGGQMPKSDADAAIDAVRQPTAQEGQKP
jgi:hypothetical protein